MNAEQHRRALEWFDRAVLHPVDRRAAILAELGNDEAVRAEVLAMLAADEAADTSRLDAGAAALQADAARDEDELVGSAFDGFEVEACIGRGGTATVFRARAADGTRVAIKVLRSGHDSHELIGRFRSERELLSGLAHAGVIALLHAGRLPSGAPYLVTELVDGPPIDRYVQAHRLPLFARLELVQRVCEAVHHAHVHLVVHRDLKPTNILVAADGAPKVVDFGIAKLLDAAAGGESWTRPGERAPMTPAYASPEQRSGGEVTTASDVYALGVILHELVTGVRPVADPFDPSSFRTASEALRARDDGSVHPIPYSASALAGDVDAIVARCLARRPDERYPSARHLSEDLRRHRSHEPITARRAPWTTRTRKFVRRRPLLSVTSGAVVTGLAVGWIASHQSLERIRASESIAWRAHANAVLVSRHLGDILDRVAAGDLSDPDAVVSTLAATERTIETDLADTPEAEGRLRAALASAYANLDLVRDAERNARRALELARVTHGFGQPDLRLYLSRLAHLIADTRPTDAATLLRELLDRCETDPAPLAELEDARRRLAALTRAP